VFLLILLVPSVLAQPRLRSVEEIAAEASQDEALIAAKARVREARARANARVRGAQVSGLADTMGVLAKRTGLAKGAQPDEQEAHTPDDTDRALSSRWSDTPDLSDSGLLQIPSVNVSRAMWNAMTTRDRVLKSGIVSVQEVSEVLSVSMTRARELVKEVHIPDEDKRSVPGRSGVPYTALIDTLYERRSNESFAQAQKLEKALGLRKRTRQLQVVAAPDDTANEEEVS
jgi:hypothetical protein